MTLTLSIDYFEAIYQIIFCFGTIVLSDIIYWIIKNDDGGRWFFIHIWINSIVSIFSLNDTYQCLTNPIECSIAPWSSNMPLIMGISGHLYHIVAFHNVSIGDYLHHFFMVFLCGFISSYIGTIGINSAIFFMTGLPGLMDYVLLSLVRFGLIDYMIEKKANVIIHIYFRMPCLVIVGSMVYASSVINNNTSSYVILIGLCLINGIYYMHDTVSNYYTKHGKKLIQ